MVFMMLKRGKIKMQYIKNNNLNYFAICQDGLKETLKENIKHFKNKPKMREYIKECKRILKEMEK